MLKTNQVLILASERSGSNLLRRILGGHDRILAPAPVHFFHNFRSILPYYGDLSQDINFSRLIRDAIQLTRIFGDWDFQIDESQVIRDAGAERNLPSVVAAIYKQCLGQSGKDIFASKEINIFGSVFEIVNTFPSIKVIYLVRDGRDVACSNNQIPGRKRGCFLHALQWRKEQLEAAKVHQFLSGKNRSFLMRYEDLLAEPENQVKRLCNYLEIDFQGEMLEFHNQREGNSDLGKSLFLRNLSKPIMQKNTGKFRSELSSRQIKIFERSAGDVLSLLGYTLVNNPNELKKISKWEEWYLRGMNQIAKHLSRREKKKPAFVQERKSGLKKLKEGIISRSFDWSGFGNEMEVDSGK